MCCCSDFNSVWTRLPRCSAEVAVKRDFLDIDRTTFFGVLNCRNISAMTVIVFFENVQNRNYISKMVREIEKKFLVFEIIASELVALNCLY